MATVTTPCPAGCGWTVTGHSPRDGEDQAGEHHQAEHVDPLRCPRCTSGLLSSPRAQRRGHCDLCDVDARLNRVLSPATTSTQQENP